MNISFEQIKIFKKINSYYKKKISTKKNYLSGFYFCSFAENIGFAKLKLWHSKKNIFLYLRIFFKEIYSFLFYEDYDFLLPKKNKKKFNTLIISWGVQKNIFKDKIYDSYFRVNSNKYQNNLWFFIIKDSNAINLQQLPNVIFIFPKKIFFPKKVFNFFSNLICMLLINRHFALENFTWHAKFSKQVNNIVKKVINKDQKVLLIPYEGQPFQTNLIRMIRKNKFNIKVNGFVHSYPPFSTHLTKGINTPDKLIVTSEDQQSTLNKYLKWPRQTVKILPSARFVLQKRKDFVNKIYLPIDFVSHTKIFKIFVQLILFFEEYDLKEFKVVNHPHSLKSKKHLRLIYDIENYLEKQPFKKSRKLTSISIFIGPTGSIIEALKHKICAYHICEDPIFESYTNKLWPSIKVQQINKNIFRYQSDNLKKLSLFGGKKNSLKKYFA